MNTEQARKHERDAVVAWGVGKVKSLREKASATQNHTDAIRWRQAAHDLESAFSCIADDIHLEGQA